MLNAGVGGGSWENRQLDDMVIMMRENLKKKEIIIVTTLIAVQLSAP